jgi:hypothetical protein
MPGNPWFREELFEQRESAAARAASFAGWDLPGWQILPGEAPSRRYEALSTRVPRDVEILPLACAENCFTTYLGGI